jgi:alkylated DNA repair protein (DNA oxidative demethylase)
MTGDLLAGLAAPSTEELADGAFLLRGFAAEEAPALLAGIERIAVAAPFRHLITPGGFRMSVAMTNCGGLGWVSDRRGYRYDPVDPETGRNWPAMPPLFRALAARAADAAGFPGFAPEACLINRYEPGTRLTLHQDRDEGNFDHPIVSVSLGVPATFLFGGLERKDRPRRIRIEHGDVAVWGGPSRLAFHGIDTLKEGHHPLTGTLRYNLTFRRAR